MKTIDYDKLLAKHKPKGFVNEDVNRIANTLICESCIQAGNGLARMLDVDTCFDNYMVIRVWVQGRLDVQETYVEYEICSQLQGELYELLSTFSYSL